VLKFIIKQRIEGGRFRKITNREDLVTTLEAETFLPILSAAPIDQQNSEGDARRTDFCILLVCTAETFKSP
jgi:hypothetical protein